MLQIKLEVVSKQGVFFSDCYASRHDAIQSCSPNVVRFDIVKAPNQFGIVAKLQRFYQAEVLVPSPVPPNLIVFPDDVAPSDHEEPKPKLPKTESTVFCKARRSKVSSFSTPKSSSPTPTSSTASIVLLAEGEAATSLALQSTVISVLGSKGEKLFVDQALLGATSKAVGGPMPAVAVPAESAAANPVNPVPAVPAPADSVPVSAGCCVDGAISTDSSQCYGFEHEAHEYCSNESITTWIWIRACSCLEFECPYCRLCNC
jgi:hypothetical protein